MGNPLHAANGLSLTPVDRQQRAAASRYLLRAARDHEDLRLLLDALGLNPTTKET